MGVVAWGLTQVTAQGREAYFGKSQILAQPAVALDWAQPQ